MAKQIRWGILGAGRIARGFAQGLRILPDARLVGIASRTVETVRQFTRMHPVERVYASYEEMVRDPSLDVIYVATPHNRHVHDVTLCLEHGKAVLCEKPFTVNARQARQVIELARARRLFCMEAMWMRFIPLIRRVAELAASDQFGDLRMLMADFGVANAYQPQSRFYNPALAGGALLDRGVYPISLAHMLFGKPDEVVGLAGMTREGVDEHSALVLRFPKGRLAVLASSLSSFGSNGAMLSGTHGKIQIHAPFFCPQRMTIERYQPALDPVGSDLTLKHRLVEGIKQNPVLKRVYPVVRSLVRPRSRDVTMRIKGNGYNYEAAEVMRCLRLGLTESPLMTLDETLQIMETMDTVRATWGLKYPGE